MNHLKPLTDLNEIQLLYTETAQTSNRHNCRMTTERTAVGVVHGLAASSGRGKNNSLRLFSSLFLVIIVVL